MSEGRVAKNSDELLRMIEEDELEDEATVQEYMAISNYARLRHITPQSVHYHVRNKHLKKYKCQCGRFVINIEEADIALKFKEPPKQKEEDNDAENEEVDGTQDDGPIEEDGSD